MFPSRSQTFSKTRVAGATENLNEVSGGSGLIQATM